MGYLIGSFMATVLITGCSSGVGASLSVLLAKKGFRVWSTMRNLSKKGSLEELATAAGVQLVIKQLDVENTDSVNRCVEEMRASEGRIDVLVNNAGAGFVRTTEQATEAEVQWIMNINFLGVVRCTKAVLPIMREAGAGRIINVTSVGGLVGQPFNEIYCASKFAVEGYTESLATYVQPGFNVKFSVVEPGGIKTEFVNNVMSNIASTGGFSQDVYHPLLMRYMSSRHTRGEGASQTADEVAEVIAAVIESEDPPLRVRTSPWAENFCRLKTEADPDGRKLVESVMASMLPPAK